MKKSTILLLTLAFAATSCSSTTPVKTQVACVVQGVNFTPNPVQVEKNLTVQLTATPKIGPKGCVGTPATEGITGWLTNDRTKITVDGQGKVRGLLETDDTNDYIYVSAKTSGKSSRVKVNVLPATLLGGVVLDAVTQTPLAGVNITFTHTGQEPHPSLTTTGGNYLTQLPAGNGYTVDITKPGYLPAQIGNLEAFSNQSRFLETLPLIPADRTGPGVVTGIVTNSVVGKGLAGATVNIRSGLNVQSGAIVAFGLTDTEGVYKINDLNTGYYTAEIVKSGFITTYFNLVSIGGLVTKDQNASISPVLADDQYRIVLTWGAIPSDLDSHLTGPGASVTGDRFHVYYAAPGPFTFGTTGVQLDVDDTSSFGPETITINKIGTGLYRYSIYDFSNGGSIVSNQLANSSARVRVYTGNRVALDINVPSGKVGTLWTVFEIQNNILRVVNKISALSDITNLLSVGENNTLDETWFQNLPQK